MTALSKSDRMIARSVEAPGYTNPVAYDADHTISYGYWICKACKSQFFGGGEAIHNTGCSLKGRVKGVFTYEDKDMLYVLGPKESGFYSPFKEADIEKIKEIAKSKI